MNQMRVSRRHGMMVAVGLSLCAPRAATGQEPQGPPAATAPAFPAEPVRSGDLIRLRIWREEDLSGEFQVDSKGTVVFPRLGEYRVTGETSESLVARLIEDYRKYLRNPSIEITVLRRINILGAVTKPGIYTVDPTITIADALGLAGGVTPAGDQNRVRIIREGQDLTTKVTERTRVGDSLIQSGDQIYVPERSVLSRNSNTFVATAASAALTLLVALLLR